MLAGKPETANKLAVSCYTPRMDCMDQNCPEKGEHMHPYDWRRDDPIYNKYYATKLDHGPTNGV